MTMTRIFIGAAVLVLAALNWAGLHDILKAEQDVTAEWTVVLCSVVLLFCTAQRIRTRRQCDKRSE